MNAQCRALLSFVLIQLMIIVPCFAFSVRYRSANANDVLVARKILFQEAMNPLSVTQNHLVVAFDQDRDGEDTLLGFGQIRPVDERFAELASLFVHPDWRGQGIGTALVFELLQRHDQCSNPDTDVCLLTLRSTSQFYKLHGFITIEESEVKINLPPALRFEFAAGSLLSTFLGNELVCMIRQR
jgi:N-acetylglutamate synthase-like GNAT family acetyltransferase